MLLLFSKKGKKTYWGVLTDQPQFGHRENNGANLLNSHFRAHEEEES